MHCVSVLKKASEMWVSMAGADTGFAIMALAVSVSWLVLVALAATTTTAVFPCLSVGVLMSLNSTLGRHTQMVLDAALQEINSDPAILNSTMLLLKYADTRNSAYHATRAALGLFEADIIGMLGPHGLTESLLIAKMASEFHVPVVSFVTAAPSLSWPHQSYFTQIMYNDAQQMATVAGIVNYYGWKEVITLYTDDYSGNTAVEILQQELEMYRSKILSKASFGKNIGTTSIAKKLVQLKDSKSRIFVLHVQAELGYKILSVAYSLGMVSTNFVWIVTEDLSNYLDKITYSNIDLTNKIQGIIGIRNNIPRSSTLKSLQLKLKSKLKDEEFENELIDNRALYAYDALWLIARAANKLLAEKNVVSFTKSSSFSHIGTGFMSATVQVKSVTSELKILNEGDDLISYIHGIHFSGITGPVRLDSNGNRANPVFEIVNFIGRGPRTVGYRANGTFFSGIQSYSGYENNFYAKIGRQQLDDVIWPGGSSKPPSGYVASSPKTKLRIAIPDKYGYSEFVSVKNDTTGKQIITGFCIEVFIAAVSRLPYNVTYDFFPIRGVNDYPNYDDLPKLVAKQEYDAAVGDIAITENRSMLVDFTQPYINSGLAAIVTEKHFSPNHKWAFLKPFSTTLWFTILLVAILTSMIIWFLELKRNKHFQGQSRGRIVKNMLFILSTIFSSQSEDVNSVLGRVVFFVWLFVVLIIKQGYTAFLTSVLTVDSLGPSIDGIAAVISKHIPIGYQGGSFVKEYLQNLGAKEAQLKSLDNISQYASALYKGPKNGGVGAIVDEMPYLQLFLSSNCDFQISGSEFRNSGWGFAFPKGSLLAKDISTAILVLSDSGELQRLHLKWLKQPQCDASKAEASTLDTPAFSGVFIITGTLCVVAIIFRIIAQIFRFHRRPINEDNSGRPPFKHFYKYLSSFCSFINRDTVQM